MKQNEQYFKVASIDELPKERGKYILISGKSGTFLDYCPFAYGGWMAPSSLATHWLKPITLSEIIGAQKGMRWVKASERLPTIPNPLPLDTPDERGVLFVNRVHSCAHLWFPSYGQSPMPHVTEDSHWSITQWEWLEESHDGGYDKFIHTQAAEIYKKYTALEEEVKRLTTKEGEQKNETPEVTEEAKIAMKDVQFTEYYKLYSNYADIVLKHDELKQELKEAREEIERLKGWINDTTGIKVTTK